jgi:hypothetical protein
MTNPRTFLVSIFAIFVAVALLSGCGGGSGSTQPPNTIVSTGNNVAPISVNGGPPGDYDDAAFISVTVCVPGTSTCQTVDNILVDTGSSGLRILSSELTVALPPQNAGDGNPVFECFPFESGYTWGPVQTADVEIAGEKASSTPIEAVGTSTAVPDGCLNFELPPSNNLDELGANGILGVGLFAQDCGSGCPTTIYYECPPSPPCQGITQSLAQQVPNPVSLFATDNNGVIVELPAVPGGEAPTLSGSLVFGIGTQSNNALGSATVYGSDPESGSFTTSFNGTAYSGSFIDSGSNGYFFLSSSVSGLPVCEDDDSFYCPSSTANLSATNEGTNGASGKVSFSIANADALPSNDNALADIGGEGSDSPPYFFDWGLPFFFGRNVFVAIQGQSAPGGTAPYWAY